MTAFSDAIQRHLRGELERPDPWNLETSAFENARSAELTRALGGGRFVGAVEVGCAAGRFTAELAERCDRLRVIDVMPEALARTQARLGPRAGVLYTLADISTCPPLEGPCDLIVVTEVLYYLTDWPSASRVVAYLAAALGEGGRLIFGSATDAACRRWGLRFGAETLMAEWSRHLREVERRECRGRRPDEHTFVVVYSRM